MKDFWPKDYTGKWIKPEYTQNLVSVIVPTYNRSGFLLDAMESVWNQSYRPIELIIVNDGSTDNTSDEINHWKMTHRDSGNFSTIEYKQINKGVSSARNQGLILSNGEFIQFLDSDDLLHSEKFSKSIDEFNENFDLDIVYTSWILSKKGEKDKVINGPEYSFKPNTYESILSYMWTASPLYKRSVIYKSGPWNEKLTRSEDREFCARVISQAKKVKKIDYPGAVYRQFVDDINITSSFSLPNPKHIKSGWIANQNMALLVELENHLNKRLALKNLAVKNLNYSKRAIACNLPRLTKEILTKDKYIWQLGFKSKIIALNLYLIASIPTKISGYIANKFINIRLKIRNRKWS